MVWNDKLSLLLYESWAEFYPKKDPYPDVSLIYLRTSFALNIYEKIELYQSFCDFQKLLHVPIWALPILGTHSFSGSNLS